MNKLDRVFIGPLVTVSVANITTAKPYARSVGLRSHLERVVKHWPQVFLQDISATCLEAFINCLAYKREGDTRRQRVNWYCSFAS